MNMIEPMPRREKRHNKGVAAHSLSSPNPHFQPCPSSPPFLSSASNSNGDRVPLYVKSAKDAENRNVRSDHEVKSFLIIPPRPMRNRWKEPASLGCSCLPVPRMDAERHRRAFRNIELYKIPFQYAPPLVFRNQLCIGKRIDMSQKRTVH